jgi:hypothetical protein
LGRLEAISLNRYRGSYRGRAWRQQLDRRCTASRGLTLYGIERGRRGLVCVLCRNPVGGTRSGRNSYLVDRSTKSATGCDGWHTADFEFCRADRGSTGKRHGIRNQNTIQINLSCDSSQIPAAINADEMMPVGVVCHRSAYTDIVKLQPQIASIPKERISRTVPAIVAIADNFLVPSC